MTHQPTVNNFTPQWYGSLPIGNDNNQFAFNHNYSRFKESLLDSDSKMKRVSEFRKKQFLQLELKKQIEDKERSKQSEEVINQENIEEEAKGYHSQQALTQFENNYSFDNREALGSFKLKRNEYFEPSFNNPLIIPQKSTPKPVTDWMHANREVASNVKWCPENILPIPSTFVK